jgi:hypothetical protein
MDAHEIMELMTNAEHDNMVKDAIAYVMEGIQCRLIIAHLPDGLVLVGANTLVPC